MPARRSQRKVPGGKLVRLDAVCEGQVISNIHISGDFFVHPEEALFSIERGLDELLLSGNEADLEERVGQAVSATGAALIGFGAGDIADLLRELKC
jgi:lipoate-protein ligase A